MQAFSAVLIFAGGLITIGATARYHKFYRASREEAYSGQDFNGLTALITLVLMYFFIVGYFIGFMDTLTRQVEPIYGVVAVSFFTGAIYIYVSVDSQIKMSFLLREKSMEVMKTFVNAIDMKDAYTKGHSQQVYQIVALIYEHLEPEMKASVSRPKLLDAALLHDIGKISIRDDVLNKAGPLAPQEWDLIKMHPAVGKQMLDDTVFRDISNWVLYHHERMDGNGYYGLEKDSIPVESRIIAIADNYGALCTDRVYRPRKDHASAIEIMMHSAGSQLDEDLMAIFLTIRPDDLAKALKV